MTKTAAAPEAAEPASTPFSLDLAEAAALGAKADGAEIAFLAAPDEAKGLPGVIPVLLRRNPALRHLPGIPARCRRRSPSRR